MSGNLVLDDRLSEGVLGRRVAAWVVDAVLQAILIGVVWACILLFGLLTLGFGWPLFGLLPLVPALYQWLSLMGRSAATPGQRMLGLTVRRNSDLGPPTPLEALAFTLLYFLTVALGVIWLAVALITVRNRTFHEIISGMVVIRAEALHAPLTASGGSVNMYPGGSNAA